MYKSIYCIGDSHISVFDNRRELCLHKTFYINGIYKIFPIYGSLAYNLGKEDHQRRIKFLNILQINNITKDDLIILSFGEVDCRNHIIKQKEKQNITIEQSSKLCVDNYFKFVLYLKILYNNICVIGPHLANTYEKNNYYGTLEDRYIVTYHFNKILEEYSKKNNICFISSFNDTCSFENNNLVFNNSKYINRPDNTGMHLSINMYDFFNKKINILTIKK